MRRLALIFSLFITVLILVSCEQPAAQKAEQSASELKVVQSATTTVSGLFLQPITPNLLELPNQALAYWRTESAPKPALVLFSFNPLLGKIDASLKERARDLALSATAEQLRHHGSFDTTEPLILPDQTVTAAIDAGLFSKIYWVFPSQVQPEQLDLAMFRNQMQEKQILTEQEGASLTLNSGVYTGQVRGIPFEALHYRMLHDIPAPLVLHIDMGFFRGLYDNEIKTPLYGLLRDTVLSLRTLAWQPLTTTLSYSTIEGAVALDVRFLISNLAEIMRKPQLMDGDMPKEWQIRGEALYAGEMYSESKKNELAQQLVKVAPESAAAHYDQFLYLFMHKELEPALKALQQAVKRDHGYGAAYLQLAQMAALDNNSSKPLELLTQAETLFPENPFIPLQKAHLLTDLGRYAEAEKILASLPQNWSPIYHQNIPGVIAELRQQINDKSAAAKTKE